MKKFIHVLAALAVLGTSCTKEIQEEPAAITGSQTLETKLVGGTDGDILPGSILVKLDSETVSMIENGNLEEATGKMMLETGAASIAPALLVKPKNIEAARKKGELK